MVLYVDLLAICEVFTFSNLVHAISGGLVSNTKINNLNVHTSTVDLKQFS